MSAVLRELKDRAVLQTSVSSNSTDRAVQQTPNCRPEWSRTELPRKQELARVSLSRVGRRASAPTSQAGFDSVFPCSGCRVVLLRVGGRGTRLHPSGAQCPCWLLRRSPHAGLLHFFLVCVGTPGLLLGCVSREKLRACGQRLIEECVDIVLGFGVPRTFRVFSSFSSLCHCNLRSRRQCSWSQRHRACGSSLARSTTVWCKGLQGGRADAADRRSTAIVSGSLCSSSHTRKVSRPWWSLSSLS